MTIENPHIIIIDDDEHYNALSKIIIRRSLKVARVQTFTEAEEGLNYIRQIFQENENEHAVLLLDINMPRVSGWDFLDRFDNFSATLKEKIKIYMLSSSIDSRDIHRAKENKHVADFYSKPLTGEMIQDICVQHFHGLTRAS